MGKLGHILITDDAEVTRDLLKQLLEGDYRITVAADGREAIACIERDRPDVLLLDLMMPVVDGFAVLAYLAAKPDPFLPVIVRSAATDGDARLRALKLGAHEFLDTTYNEGELEVRIKTMLALKRARDAAEQRSAELETQVADRTSELRNALEDLQATNRYKDEFLSVMSHELLTPLGFIIAYASSLEDGLAGELTAQQAQFVGSILHGGERLKLLIDNLIDISLMATGKFLLDPHDEWYAPLVERSIEAVRPLAEERGIFLASDVQVPEPVWLDDQRTAQALINLIRNAVNFTHVGGKVVVKAYLRENCLVTEVEDNGIGISQVDMFRLFQPFKQLDMSSTREVGGSGLGLKLAKGIVEAHGGEIGVRSAPGAGSTFWFELPAERPAPVAPSATQVSSSGSPAAR